MIIGKFNREIVFSPNSGATSLNSTPRPSESSAPSSQSKGIYKAPSHVKSLSQFNTNITKDAEDILKFYQNEGFYSENTSKNTAKDKIKDLKKFGFLENLEGAFSKLLKNLSETDKEYYDSRFKKDIEKINKKQDEESREMREGRYNKSSLNLIEISSVKSPSPSKRGVLSPTAKESSSLRKPETPLSKESSSLRKPGTPLSKGLLSFSSQKGASTTRGEFSSPIQSEASTTREEFSSPSQPEASPGIRNKIHGKLSQIYNGQGNPK